MLKQLATLTAVIFLFIGCSGNSLPPKSGDETPPNEPEAGSIDSTSTDPTPSDLASGASDSGATNNSDAADTSVPDLNDPVVIDSDLVSVTFQRKIDDSTITALFSDSLPEEPANWAVAFTVKKNNEGESICDNVSYDAETRTAKCSYKPLMMEAATTYTVAISGIDGISNASYSFKSTPNPVGAQFWRYLDAEDGSTIRIDYRLWSPVLNLPSMTIKSISANETRGEVKCDEPVRAEDGGFISVSCKITGLDDNSTFTEYIVTLSGGGVEASYAFNSANELFDHQSVFEKNWTKMTDLPAAIKTKATVESGHLKVTALNDTQNNFEMHGVWLKPIQIPNDADFAALMRHQRDSSSRSESSEILSGVFGDNEFSVLIGKQYTADSDAGWHVRYSPEHIDASDKPQNESASLYGDLASSIAEKVAQQGYIYTCFVRHQNAIKTYVSYDDGANFTQLTHANTECTSESCLVFSDTFDSFSGANSHLNMLILVKAEGGATAKAEGVFGPVLFKTVGITEDGANDCRSMMNRF